MTSVGQRVSDLSCETISKTIHTAIFVGPPTERCHSDGFEMLEVPVDTPE